MKGSKPGGGQHHRPPPGPTSSATPLAQPASRPRPRRLERPRPEIASESVLDENAPADVPARFEIVFAEMARQVTENEAPLRAMLRLSLEAPAKRGELLLRRGRKRVWVADALEPLAASMARIDFDRLVLAVTVATGIEAFVWLTDMAGLSRKRALEVMRFSAETLIESARA